MPTINVYKYFDGKLYEFAGKRTTKAEAESLEKRLRKSGYLVRVIRSSAGHYMIYGKEKGSGPYSSRRE